MSDDVAKRMIGEHVKRVLDGTLEKMQSWVGDPKIDPKRDTVTPGTRLKCIWTVEAGVIPGEPAREYTRRWMLSGETWERENAMTDDEFKSAFPDGRSTFARFFDEAYAYARSLGDPRLTNFVRVDWTWL